MEELLHPLLKAPFEKANKSFRLFHKHVSREIAAMQKAVLAFQEEQPPAQHARVDETIDALENLADRIRNAQHDTKQFLAEQQKDINSCVLRAQYVHKYREAGDALAASAHAAARVGASSNLTSPCSKNDQQSMENDRLIADYLLSHGFVKSSKLIQEAKGVEFVVDHDLHLQCRAILNDLHAHNVATAISWCSDNASRLRRLGSQLEFQLRLQEFVELVRSDKKLEAIQYAQTNLTPISLQHEDDTVRKTMMESIQEAMATLAYKSPDQCGVESYSRLFSVDRWETLKTSFRTTFCLVYAIHNPPALCVALHAGLSSLNTRTCRRNRDATAESRKHCHANGEDTTTTEAGESASSLGADAQRDQGDNKRQSDAVEARQRTKKTKTVTESGATSKSHSSGKATLSEQSSDAMSAPPLCPTCSDVGAMLCSGLPFAHHPHSRLVCRVTQTVMDEHNPPVALPNGYVFSQRAIQHLTAQDDAMIKCPVTQDKYSTSVLKAVYIL